MNIRSKIILITLPLIITPLILTLIVAGLSARNGITVVATEFLTFKTEVLNNYIENQWNLLVSNEMDENKEFINISKSAVEGFAKSLVKSKSEHIFAVDYSGDIVMQSSELQFSENDKELFKQLIKSKTEGWQNISVNNLELIAETSFFEPFNWFIFVAVEKETFYGSITQLYIRIGIIFLISLIIAIILLIGFSSYLTKPLEDIVEAIKNIITTNDLSTKVTLQYKDETGKLGHFFNIMTGELEKAYNQMKRYALQAVVSEHKEKKIRNIFQKYVPKDVIDKFFSDPESMLVGENRVLSILFSDIRGFTTISESLEPNEVVESLNKYFETMVDIITGHKGIVDKYMGDAIMAFFGAPVKHEDDALQSVLTGLDMLDKLNGFNDWQRKKGREEFKIGIGINYGDVTIGNIGSEKKMDYTIIGDMVNTASRLEGLTKYYKEPILISESLYNEVSKELPCRIIDKAIVKGKTVSVNIYSVCKTLSPTKKEAWEAHEAGIEYYFNRDFRTAMTFFQITNKLLPNDISSKLFLENCDKHILNPPKEDWTGYTIHNIK